MWRGALIAFPVLVIGLAFALLWRKRFDLALFLLPSFGLVLIYALFTPFFWRYGWPSRLVANLTILILFKLMWDMFGARRATAPTKPFAAT
jgi:hypothetical protein